MNEAKVETKKRKGIRWVDVVVGLLFVGVLLAVHHYKREGSFMNADVLEKVESYYNTIFVYQTKDGKRHMMFGYQHNRYFEAVHQPGQPKDLELPYTQMMTVGISYDPEVTNVLSIGMGGGGVSSYVLATMPEPHVTEVELDPEVVRLAKKYFEYADTPRRTVVSEDGRKFLTQTSGVYDLVFLDAYRGPFVPFHMLTQEFYTEVKKHMAPGGVVVQNISSETLLADSTFATMEHAFDQVEMFKVGDNVIGVAYDGPRKTDAELLQHAQALDAAYHFPYSQVGMVRGRMAPAVKPGTKVLTDDFAPVDTLNAIDRHNQKWK